LLWSVLVDIPAPGDFEAIKTRVRNLVSQLYLQQSPGDSTGPQLDVSFGSVWDWFINQNISNL
jgi:hypothetical protein